MIEIDSTARTLHAEVEFGLLDLMVSANALAANPKASALSAFSIIRVIDNRVRPVTI